MGNEQSTKDAVSDIISQWISDPKNNELITVRKTIPANEAKYAAAPDGLSAEIIEALNERGIEKLYSHQVESINHTLAGKNVVIVTPTASGKTECYNLPVLNEIIGGNGSALYLFPTKALAQDQLAELERWQLSLEKNIEAYTYDGDTSADRRRSIRKRANILITNPDMLHIGILPHHTRWASYFSRLKYIVIDEMHVYRGVFGSHFANLLRRLKRISDFYGSSPLFICSSATIANPVELASELIGERVELVDESGAPTHEKEVIFLNPPLINSELGLRANYLRVARTIARFFLQNMIQTLVFATSRMNVEIILKYLREDFRGLDKPDDFVKGYRGGYLPNVRRTIEKGLRDGSITGVIATNALELGIDIGGLDACILAGYPGSVASTWQQVGRVGRRGAGSVAILVAKSRPIDQFIVNFSDYFFGRSPEHGLINPDNLHILVDHLISAAFELPINSDEKFGDENLGEILEYLEEKGVLHRSGKNYHYVQDKYPAENISLRNIGSHNILVIDTTDGNKVIAEVDQDAAFRTVHENAIYLLEGSKYIVDKLDLDKGKAFVSQDDSDYFTVARTNSEVKVLASFDIAMYGPSPVEHGEIELSTETVGFKKIKFYTGENLGEEELDLPERTIQTTGYWFVIKEEITDSLDFTRAELIDGIMGIANVTHNIASLVLMCDSKDIGVSVGDRSCEWFVKRGAGEFRVSSKREDNKALKLDSIAVFEPAIYIYDNYPGGIGFSPVLFREHSGLLTKSKRLIEKCSCVDGCPSCVGPAEEIGIRGKEASLALLNSLISV